MDIARKLLESFKPADCNVGELPTVFVIHWITLLLDPSPPALEVLEGLSEYKEATVDVDDVALPKLNLKGSTAVVPEARHREENNTVDGEKPNPVVATFPVEEG